MIFEVLLTAKNAEKKYAKGAKKKMTENKIFFKMSLELKKKLRTRNADF